MNAIAQSRAEHILGVPMSNTRWSCVRVITPEMAQRILVAQPRQRPVNAKNLTKLCTAIKKGQFVRTHQGISFDEDGALSDGQHRLTACVETQTPIEVVCFFNEPRGLFSALDGGAVRDLGVNAYLAGHIDDPRNRSLLVSAARFLWAYDQGSNPVHAATRQGWDDDALAAVLLRHAGLPGMIDRVGTRSKLPRSPLVALFTLFSEANEKRAAVFIHQVLTGENLKAGDPAHTLRENAIHSSGGTGKSRIELAYRIARAWNHYIAGNKAQRLYGSQAGGSVNRKRTMDAFPEIAGYKRPSAPAVQS